MDSNTLNALNILVKVLIFHGGDKGGPYFTESEAVKMQMNTVAFQLGIDWEWDISEYSNEGEIPKFVQKDT